MFLDATVVRGVLVPAAMAVMGRGNWWWPGQRYARQQYRTALPQEITATVHQGSATVRDEKQAVGAFGRHAGAARVPVVGPAGMRPGRHERYAFGSGRIHHAADIAQTVVLERVWQEPTG